MVTGGVEIERIHGRLLFFNVFLKNRKDSGMEGSRSEEIVKVMAREGQLSRIKMVCRQEEEEGSRLVSVQGKR